MFRIDNRQVVDATMTGNAARYVNHSCEVRGFIHSMISMKWFLQPNCASRIITYEEEKRIVIFAQRDIGVGEELTYDYKVIWALLMSVTSHAVAVSSGRREDSVLLWSKKLSRRYELSILR